MVQMPLFNEHFDGPGYEPSMDRVRLNRQLQDVYNLMKDGFWRSLYEMERLTGYPTQSLSARLRDLRKDKFGGHEVNRRRREGGNKGTWEYRLILNPV